MDFVATPPHCAFCLRPLPDESVTCLRCRTPYCSVECRRNALSEEPGCAKRWTEATWDEETGEGVLPPPQSHRSVCSDIARVGIEKHYATVEAREEAKIAVRDCASAVEAVRVETGAPTCYICLGDEPGLVRACSCRGTGGFAHLECLANYARAQSPEGCFSFRWHTCRNCKDNFTGSTRLALARECWRTYCSEPNDEWRRMFSMDCLVRSLVDTRGGGEEALRFAKAFLDTLQAVDPDNNHNAQLGARDNLGFAYSNIGLHTEALDVTQSLYDLCLAKYGPTHVSTLRAATNLSCDLENCGFELKRRTLLRDAYDRSLGALGPDHSTTSSLRYNLATSLFRDGADAPHEDIVEAAALMRLCVEQRSQANGPDHPSTKSARHLEERVLDALERSERPAKRARRTLRLRDVDTRGDPEHQEVLRIQRRVTATTRAATRNDERRRHFVVAIYQEQLRRRTQRAREEREEQQRSRSRCVVS